MTRIAVVLSVACLVVLVFILVDRGGMRTAGPLDPTAHGAGGGGGPEEALRPGVRTGAVAAGGVPVAARDFHASVEARGPVGAAIRSLIEKTHGSDAATMDRSFASEDIYNILEAWRRDPSRKSDDIEFFIEIWNEFEDSGVRYALSWLFRYAQDDRLVDPLMDLVTVYPWQAVDALAAIGTPRAIEGIAIAEAAMQRPEERAQASLRIASSSWERALDHLKGVWRDENRSDMERFVAVEALGRRPEDPEARLQAFEIATGTPVPLTDLGERNREHSVRDLRAAAVVALMHAGDGVLVRRLLEIADAPHADPRLAEMIDGTIHAFTGGDLSRVVLDRVNRRGRISAGEAQLLAQNARAEDLPELRRLRDLATDPTARQILEGAILSRQSW